ncbi:MAG: EpsG family protein [Sulfurovum sp.]|nr:MAG: EpsG family protein [Sulfurovum sp.]
MITYWIMYLATIVSLFITSKFDGHSKNIIYIGYFLFVSSIIGFRYQIGGDWFPYVEHYEQCKNISLAQALKMGDSGYMSLNWIMAQFDLGIGGVNLFCGVVIAYALIVFANRQTFPWLSLGIAVPYFVIVISMGYARQAVATAFVMLAYTQWSKEPWKFIILVVIGALFHKTAILVLIFSPVILNGSIWLKSSTIIILFPSMYFLFLADSLAEMQHGYAGGGENNMKSEGGAIRVMMNIIPAILFMLFYKKFQEFKDFKLWLYIAIASMLSFIFVGTFSTAVDRLAVYLIPIQMMVYGRLPMFITNSMLQTLFIIAIILMYAIIMYVWLNFATNAIYWLPYKIMLFGDYVTL